MTSARIENTSWPSSSPLRHSVGKLLASLDIHLSESVMVWNNNLDSVGTTDEAEEPSHEALTYNESFFFIERFLNTNYRHRSRFKWNRNRRYINVYRAMVLNQMFDIFSVPLPCVLKQQSRWLVHGFFR